MVYNGIQQRANNTAIINAASQTIKAIQAYVTLEGDYPSRLGGYICVTNQSGCATTNTSFSGNSGFNANMQEVGSPPSSIPRLAGDNRYGIMYHYHGTRTVDNLSAPAILLYYLDGIGQSCGVGGILDGTGVELSLVSRDYTSANSGSTGKTACAVTLGAGV